MGFRSYISLDTTRW